MILVDRLQRSFAAPKVGFGQWRLQRKKKSCWAIGDETNGSVFGTVDAEITPETVDFFVSEAEGDPDRPSEGYSSIEHAINTLRQGKVKRQHSTAVTITIVDTCWVCFQFVIVVDDEIGESTEGNIVMAASLTSPSDVAFMVRHGSGIVSVGMKDEDLLRLKLPLMSPETEDDDSSAPTFTVTVVRLIALWL